MIEESITKLAKPVGEESHAASRHCSCAISRAERDTGKDVEVETPADDEQSPPPMEAACRVGREWRVDVEPHVKATEEVDVERSTPNAKAARGFDVGRQSPGAEVVGRVAEERPTPWREVARGGGAAAEGVDVDQPAVPMEVTKGVEVERQPPPPSGRAPSTEERRMCETGSMYGVPSKDIW